MVGKLTAADTWLRSLPPWIESCLIYLVRFHDIHSYEHWEEPNLDFTDNSDRDDILSDESNSLSKPNDSSQHERSFGDRVQKHLQRAAEKLAS